MELNNYALPILASSYIYERVVCKVWVDNRRDQVPWILLRWFSLLSPPNQSVICLFFLWDNSCDVIDAVCFSQLDQINNSMADL